MNAPVLQEKTITQRNAHAPLPTQNARQMRRIPEKYTADMRIWSLALLNAAIFYYCLELGNKNPLMNGLFYTFVNIFTVFSLMAGVYTLVRRWWISSLIVGIPCTVLGIANYYTLL